MRNVEMEAEPSWVRIRRKPQKGTTNENAKADTALNKMSPLPSYFPINLKHWCNFSARACSAVTKHVYVCELMSAVFLH